MQLNNAILKNAGLWVVLLAMLSSCNIDVKNGDASGADSNLKSGVSVHIINEIDSVNHENAKELLKKADTEVQHLNRQADSTRAVLENKKKEIQKDIEQ